MSMTPKKQTRRYRESLSEEEEFESPTMTSPDTSQVEEDTGKKNDELKAKNNNKVPDPFKRSVTLKYSPPNKKVTFSAAEVIKKPTDNAVKTYAKSTIAPSSMSNFVPAELPIITTPARKKYKSRESEARANLAKACLHLKDSKNLKTEIKTGVQSALDRLFALVKESEEEVKELREALEEGNIGTKAPGEQRKSRERQVQIRSDLEEREKEERLSYSKSRIKIV
ncbi:hypothetical protein K1T71_012410 [Dendrolimus kikuchii]|uniref:Uncharacterized protein n=1 Tax=Dendrolimus kikuchii TaxID=765133 RepID=A0ACC1CJ96_9NEOP|nr:hypothetical protein K1T71_012410 [Dendrolimus kikuchii]